jgi:serine/threonine protein phosphatase PrpC
MSLLQYSAATDVGLKRTNNEDTILSNPLTGLWLVADGMGGHAAGEVASVIAAETIDSLIARGQTLQQAVHQAHEAIVRAAAAGVGGAGMGSTVVALHSRGDTYDIAWVGDSRAYLWRPGIKGDKAGGELIQLTTDHSYVQMLFDKGIINAEEMHQHPEKNIITQCLGSQELNSLSVDVRQLEWQADDWILLCSDGLSDAVSDAQITDILRRKVDLRTATHALIAQALEQGGRDNISVSIVACPNGLQRGLQSAVSPCYQWRQKLLTWLDRLPPIKVPRWPWQNH